MSSIANVDLSNSVSSHAAVGDLVANIEFSALYFNERIADSWNIADNIRVMCSSKEFIQNPRDALLNWLIIGVEDITTYEDKQRAFASLMQCIPHFEEVATLEYLEGFGVRYFAQSPTRDQSLDILRKHLNSSFIQKRLEEFTCFYAKTKVPGKDFLSRLIDTGAALKNLKIALRAFWYAEQLRNR